ncbi:MAG: hypothetical protein KKD17_00340 [Nanoarchaeota archaeon]|nr:hypothetical protein [Nanoarchaeota archaeon]
MKKGIIILAILAVLLAGCASQRAPNIICSSPYMRHGDGCCLDKNSNSICDVDEEEEPFFVEPDYAPGNEIPDITEDIEEQIYEEPVYEEPAEEPEPTYIGVKDEVKKVSTKYTAPETRITGWSTENDHMSLEITDITFDVVSVTPLDRISPDKEVFLKEMRLTVKNKDYNYLNPQFYFRVGDSKDPIIIKETLLCDRSDDIVMEGCNHALPEAETMQVIMRIDRKVPRIDLQKTIRLTLQNRRDSDDKNILEIEKTTDILKISGAKYT